MRRVKDYNTFLSLKESFLTTSKASKVMTKLIDPSSRREVKAKSKETIESSFGDDSAVDTYWAWDPSVEGFSALSSLFGGRVVLRELEEDDSSDLEYEVVSGLNKGKRGEFEWGGSGKSRTPIFSEPYNTKWKDLLGPDEDFLKTYTSPTWKTVITDCPGVEIKKVGEKGVCEIIYDDKYQFYGKVRIYYSGEGVGEQSNSTFNYEVQDGPNAGLKGNGIRVFENGNDPETLKFGDGSGVFNPFSSGDLNTSVRYACVGTSSNKEKIAYGKEKATGTNPGQAIFLNTSELTSIKPPSAITFKELYPSAGNTYKIGEISKDKSCSIIGELDAKKIKQYFFSVSWSNDEFKTEGDKEEGTFDGYDFPDMKGNTSGKCYLAFYQGNPLILYTVPSKANSGGLKLDWNQEKGIYGNNFFVGRLSTIGGGKISVKGEWYYDYATGGIGIIYAYSINDSKKEYEITSEIINGDSYRGKPDLKVDFTDPKNPTGIVKDPGNYPQPIKVREIPNLKFDYKNLK
jgi:hypothetical protein